MQGRQIYDMAFNGRKKICMLGVIAILLFIPAIASAASNYWNVASGDWSTAANWQTGIEPTSSDTAYIQNGGTATITQTGERCRYLYLGATDTGTIEMIGGSLTISSGSYVGDSGTGTFTQTGGTNSISSRLYIGNDSGSTGIYNLSGAGKLSAGVEYIGYSGMGTFTQTGGTNTILSSPLSSSLYLGNNSGSSGTYNLTGTGQLSAVFEYIGYSGTGIFTQTGGTNSIGQILNIGEESGSSGTYELSGDGQLSALEEWVGTFGTGKFKQTGGTNSIGQLLYIGSHSGSSSTYELGGDGQLSAPEEWVGLSGTGMFKQTGGTNSVGHPLFIGNNHNSKGIYELSGDGHLSAENQYVGTFGTGTFTQSGGINSISTHLYLGYDSGSSGTYELSDDGQLSAENQYVGYFGTGTFTQSGGINSISTYLYLGYNSGSSGTYNLNGGTLILRSLRTGSGTASFNFGGGTLKISSHFGTSLPITLTGINGNANIDSTGYYNLLSGVLSGPGGLNKLGSGTLTLSGINSYYGETNVNAGILALTSSGSIANSPLIDVKSGAYLNVSAKTSGFSLGSSQTLEGAGTVTGSVVAASGSHIAPGDSAGVLTFSGNLTLNSGALLDFDLGDILESDKIYMHSSILYLNGQQFSDFNFTALSGFGAGIYTLIDAAVISGSLGDNLSGAIGAYTASLSISGNDLVLNVVPEPGTWLVLAMAFLAIFVGKRMGRKGR
jgi:autotransporter-associated beta strand protein